jgi:phage shock protein A
MEDKKLLKSFYLIADELDKNIIKFNELEEQLKIAKENDDLVLAESLLKEYKEVANRIKEIKEKAQKLKEEVEK